MTTPVLESIYQPLLRSGHLHYGLISTQDMIDLYQVDLDFQRGVVWTEEQLDLLAERRQDLAKKLQQKTLARDTIQRQVTDATKAQF